MVRSDMFVWTAITRNDNYIRSAVFVFQVTCSVNRQCLLLLILVDLPWDDKSVFWLVVTIYNRKHQWQTFWALFYCPERGKVSRNSINVYYVCIAVYEFFYWTDCNWIVKIQSLVQNWYCMEVCWYYFSHATHKQRWWRSEIHVWVPWLGSREVTVRGVYHIECDKTDNIFQLVTYQYLCVECNGFI
jgi:hypothetical protein